MVWTRSVRDNICSLTSARRRGCLLFFFFFLFSFIDIETGYYCTYSDTPICVFHSIIFFAPTVMLFTGGGSKFLNNQKKIACQWLFSFDNAEKTKTRFFQSQIFVSVRKYKFCLHRPKVSDARQIFAPKRLILTIPLHIDLPPFLRPKFLTLIKWLSWVEHQRLHIINSYANHFFGRFQT